VPLCEQSYPCRSLRVRIPVLRATWKEIETSPKSDGFQFGIEDIFLSFGVLLPRRRTTHYRLRHDVRRTTSQSASARSGRHNFSNCETILGERNFIRSALSHQNTIYVFPRFSGFQLKITFLTCRKQVFTAYVMVMTHFEIPIAKGATTVYALWRPRVACAHRTSSASWLLGATRFCLSLCFPL